MTAVTIETLRIKIDKDLTLELSPEKARKLRDVLLEVFPDQKPAPIVIERYLHEWPYRYWEPYYWTTSGPSSDQCLNNGYTQVARPSDTSAATLFCSVEG